MISAHGYAAQAADQDLAPFGFERRSPGPNDVVLEILYCGICHSDLHYARNEWGGTKYPVVPGHEIVGRVTATGGDVTRFKVGDIAAIGCFVDSCRTCPSCRAGEENYCEEGMTATYNGYERGTNNLTQGGYSNNYVVDENYALHIRHTEDLAAVAPLLCAGITTYSPLRHWKVGPGQRVGVVGLGGLGHMAVKLASAMGAGVTVFTTSAGKADDARRLGADRVVVSKDTDAMKREANTLDFIIDTVSAPHDLHACLALLKRDGVMCLVGMPDQPASVHAGALVVGRKSLSGSMIGGIRETQEMLDFCAEHGITSDIELISISAVNEAYDRLQRSDVKYRFVIDMASLRQ